MVKSNERVNVVDEDWNVWGSIVETTSSRRQEEAFYILDLGDIVDKFRRWKDKMPRVEPYYGKCFKWLNLILKNYQIKFFLIFSAVKCNDQQIILEVLAALGANFDCASKAEINQVLDIGVTAE